jgi:hypothetical protein
METQNTRPFSATNGISTEIYCCGEPIYKLRTGLRILTQRCADLPDTFLKVKCPKCNKRTKLRVGKE